MAQPSIIGGLGGGEEALDKAKAELAKVISEQAAEVRRGVEAQRRRNDKRESAAPMTVSDALNAHVNSEQEAYFRDDFKTAAPGVDPSFRNKDRIEREVAIQRVNQDEAKAERTDDTERAAAATNFKTAIAAATITVGSFISALNRIAEAQSRGSADVNKMRIERSDAMKSLGYDEKSSETRRKRAESGSIIPGNISAQDETELLSIADASRGGMPANAAMRSSIDSVIYDSNLTMAQKRAAMRTPQVAKVTATLASQGGRGYDRIGNIAKSEENALAAIELEGQAKGASKGMEGRTMATKIDAAQAEGSALGFVTSIGIPGLGTIGDAAKAVNAGWNNMTGDRVIKVINVDKPPPSVTDGRSK